MTISGHSCLVRSGVVLLLAVLHLPAQTFAWRDLQAVAAGTEVRVEVSGAKAVQGQLRSVDDDAVSVILDSGKSETYARQVVKNVSVGKPEHRGRNALKGAGIGAGAGLGVGLAVGMASRCTGFCIISNSESTAIATAGGGISGGIIGAIIGAAVPGRGWTPVYRQ